MGIEIERKFLVRGEGWRRGPGVLFRQGYLAALDHCVVRVRTMGEDAVLTVKSRAVGPRRAEYEYAVPVPDALEMLGLCPAPPLEKTRYHVGYAGLVWDVDEYHGANAGLVVAECELEREDQPVTLPPWVGEEITDDHRFANSSLVARPYTTW